MGRVVLVVILVFSFMFMSQADDSGDNLLSPKGVNYEVAALMSIKKEMKDAHSVLTGWDINSVDPCTWAMVGCSPKGFVVTLEMASSGLSGVLSSSIGNLSHLKTMLLQNNQLSGPIPAELGKLSNLQTLDLSGNRFIGEVPDSLGLLTGLNYLRLSRNNLSGQIPGSVANLSDLSFLDLAFNNLSGPTPKILAKGYSITGNSFLCTASSGQNCLEQSKPINQTSLPQKVESHHRWVISLAIGLSCTFTVSVLLLVYWVHCYRSRLPFTSYVQHDYEFDIGHLQRFSFRELQNATNNFSPKSILGQGGFGVVYKGCLPNGTMIAVKRLKDPNFTGERQFQTEVEMIGLALHRNLLRLYGFCMSSNERLLVYPYMSNGSVADRLRVTTDIHWKHGNPFLSAKEFGSCIQGKWILCSYLLQSRGDRGQEKPSLDWNKRTCIALGTARGLLYLHEQCCPKIIHRDVKAANILLDESFEAVVGDFGLAKLLDRRDSHVTTAVRGTVGHIAPEYLSTGQSSEKTDVFGFGVLLLELITGPKALDAANGQVQKGMILDWVKTLHEEKRLEMLVDKDLRGCFNPEELEMMVESALMCTQSNPSLRPKMSVILKVLEGIVSKMQPGDTEETHGGTTSSEERAWSFSRNYSDGIEETSFRIEAIELSGPR